MSQRNSYKSPPSQDSQEAFNLVKKPEVKPANTRVMGPQVQGDAVKSLKSIFEKKVSMEFDDQNQVDPKIAKLNQKLKEQMIRKTQINLSKQGGQTNSSNQSSASKDQPRGSFTSLSSINDSSSNKMNESFNMNIEQQERKTVETRTNDKGNIVQIEYIPIKENIFTKKDASLRQKHSSNSPGMDQQFTMRGSVTTTMNDHNKQLIPKPFQSPDQQSPIKDQTLAQQVPSFTQHDHSQKLRNEVIKDQPITSFLALANQKENVNLMNSSQKLKSNSKQQIVDESRSSRKVKSRLSDTFLDKTQNKSWVNYEQYHREQKEFESGDYKSRREAFKQSLLSDLKLDNQVNKSSSFLIQESKRSSLIKLNSKPATEQDQDVDDSEEQKESKVHNLTEEHQNHQSPSFDRVGTDSRDSSQIKLRNSEAPQPVLEDDESPQANSSESGNLDQIGQIESDHEQNEINAQDQSTSQQEDSQQVNDIQQEVIYEDDLENQESQVIQETDTKLDNTQVEEEQQYEEEVLEQQQEQEQAQEEVEVQDQQQEKDENQEENKVETKVEDNQQNQQEEIQVIQANQSNDRQSQLHEQSNNQNQNLQNQQEEIKEMRTPDRLRRSVTPSSVSGDEMELNQSQPITLNNQNRLVFTFKDIDDPSESRASNQNQQDQDTPKGFTSNPQFEQNQEQIQSQQTAINTQTNQEHQVQQHQEQDHVPYVDIVNFEHQVPDEQDLIDSSPQRRDYLKKRISQDQIEADIQKKSEIIDNFTKNAQNHKERMIFFFALKKHSQVFRYVRPVSRRAQ